MTLDQALADTSVIAVRTAMDELRRHGKLSRSCPIQGMIEVFEEATDADGNDASCWVEIPRSAAAIMAWLGY